MSNIEFYRPTKEELYIKEERPLPSKSKLLSLVWGLYNYDFFKKHNWEWLNIAIKIVSVGNQDIILRILEDFKGKLAIEHLNINFNDKLKLIKFIKQQVTNAIEKQQIKFSKDFLNKFFEKLEDNLIKDYYFLTIRSIKSHSYPTMRKNFKKIIKILDLPPRKRYHANCLREHDFLILFKRLFKRIKGGKICQKKGKE